MRRGNLFIGIFIGLILPAICFYLLVERYYQQTGFQELLELPQISSKILSICAISNLLPFYLFLNKKHYQTVRGVILATIFFAVIAMIVRFFI